MHLPVQHIYIYIKDNTVFLGAIGNYRNSASPGRASGKRLHWSKALAEDGLELPRTAECFSLIERDNRLDYSLPRQPKMTAGLILKHCYEALDAILKRRPRASTKWAIPMMLSSAFTTMFLDTPWSVTAGRGWLSSMLLVRQCRLPLSKGP